MKRFDVELYEDVHGFCPIATWLKELDRLTNKENRSMLRKVYYQIERLEMEGLGLGEPIAKHIEADIWELRPIPNRILFAVIKNNKILLLHHFRKKTQKTPKSEIEQAKREYRDWINRGEQK